MPVFFQNKTPYMVVPLRGSIGLFYHALLRLRNTFVIAISISPFRYVIYSFSRINFLKFLHSSLVKNNVISFVCGDI